MSTDDSALRAMLQQIRRRANLTRDAALALTVETARESDLPGLIAALQDAYTELRLALAEREVRDGTNPSIKMDVVWPDAPPPFPRGAPRIAPWKRGDNSEPD